MTPDPLDSLLKKLTSGDPAAAEQVFRAYEPYLRMVVRRQLPPKLRAKFDSVDVVQSVWVDLVHGFRAADWEFKSAAQLRAFLVKVTHNRFIDRVRRYRRMADRETPLDALAGAGEYPAVAPEGGAELEADELWHKLLALCPPAHRGLLRLKRQGCSLAEIAARTGLHPSSVRRILYELAHKLSSEPVPARTTAGPGAAPAP